jgi:hypothetical protein
MRWGILLTPSREAWDDQPVREYLLQMADRQAPEGYRRIRWETSTGTAWDPETGEPFELFSVRVLYDQKESS